MSCKHKNTIINVFFVIILLNLTESIRADNFSCYTCTYSRSADPTVSYECITNVDLEAQVECEPPYVCKTVTLFQTNMTTIRSVTRNCLPRGTNCVGDICCNTAGPYPLCEEKCGQQLCNNINPETWLSPGQSQTTRQSDEATDASQENNTGTSSQDSVANVTIPAHLFNVNTACYIDTTGVYNLISMLCLSHLVLLFGRVG